MGGAKLWDYFPTLSAALKTVYPHEPWSSRKFLADRMQFGHWKNVESLRAFFDRVGPELGVNEVKNNFIKVFKQLINVISHIKVIRLVQH